MNKGDYMVHWSGKVCMVEDMAEMNLTGTKRMYFILTPVRDKAERSMSLLKRRREPFGRCFREKKQSHLREESGILNIIV